MTSPFILPIICGILVVLLSLSWIAPIGPRRAFMAGCCRVLWLMPLFSALFPRTSTFELHRTMQLKPIHILVDDSQSMRLDSNLQTLLSKVEAKVELIKEECKRLGCVPQVSYLSDEDALVEKGFSPLSKVIPAWIYKLNSYPWVVFSDGGDYQPTVSWSKELKDSGLEQPRDHSASASPKQKGMVVGMIQQEQENVWLEDADIAPFSFETKPLDSMVYLRRTGSLERNLQVQVQIDLDNQTLATSNATFLKGQDTSYAQIPIPPLPRGAHLLTIRALPTPAEKTLWDNSTHRNVEVLANTVGILHLLGSPSWDGRFLRRYLKAEPKYDLISFFILRDPWDSQQVNERELSLIPFPVSRLFNEELPNFRAIILQDFTLLQFLLPEYQKNLVNFVKSGGGLLFIGGERALLDIDIQNSPLKEILPFELKKDLTHAGSQPGLMNPFLNDIDRQPVNKFGPWFDHDLSYRIELAQPDAHRRSLANVYDDWELLADSLDSFANAKGLHHTENVIFKEGHYTPLLYAKTSDNNKIPLAVASYPGKGRAIWLFTDSMWRMALQPKHDTPREIYHRFMQGAMTWLLRQDLKKPLVASSFKISPSGAKSINWQVGLQGAAVRYFDPHANWQVLVCGVEIEANQIILDKLTDESWTLSGSILTELRGGQRCRLSITGEHQAFGSVKVQAEAIYPETFSDTQITGSLPKLKELAKLSGAEWVINDHQFEKKLINWLENNSSQDGISLPSRYKTALEYYWILKEFWIWFLLIFIPLEVIIRRWHHLTSNPGGAKGSEKTA